MTRLIHTYFTFTFINVKLSQSHAIDKQKIWNSPNLRWHLNHGCICCSYKIALDIIIPSVLYNKTFEYLSFGQTSFTSTLIEKPNNLQQETESGNTSTWQQIENRKIKNERIANFGPKPTEINRSLSIDFLGFYVSVCMSTWQNKNLGHSW